jgi:glucose uptake protein GlcU
MLRRSLTPLILAFSRTHVETLKHHRLDASVAMPLDEAQITRRVTQSTLANLAIAVGVLSGVSMLRSQPDMQGWMAAAGAALVFGGSSLPAKHPAAAAAGTLGFQLWVTIGNSALNLMLLLLLNVPIQWSQYGVVGAAVLTGTQLFAWPAIQRLGAAVGPGIWCGVGMLTSFLWGVFVFHEPFKTPALAVMALVMLVGGVGGVASSQVLNHRDASNQPPPPSQPPPLSPAAEELDGSGSSAVVSASASPALPLERPSEPLSALVLGVACALGTGLLDGSLMAPFSSYKTSLGLAPGDQVALRYLGGFALALPVVALLPLLLALLVEHLRQGARSTRRLLPLDGRRSPARFLNLSCALSGMSCGALWAAGNVLSVHASMRLGQAVGFPLTQVCVVISALWGIFFFGELPQPRARALFASSSVVVLAGAVALKASGGGVL